MAFSVYTRSCNHHHYLIAEYFHHSKIFQVPDAQFKVAVLYQFSIAAVTHYYQHSGLKHKIIVLHLCHSDI